MEEICENLDKLTMKSLELMEEKISANIEMETILRDGHIELAKARYIRGKESIGRLQIPTEDEEIESLFELETIKSNEMDIPVFDISLRKSSNTEKAIPNPIKRFGVLVPQNLKNAQKRFQESLFIAAKIANVSAQILNNENEFQSLMKEKQELSNTENKENKTD